MKFNSIKRGNKREKNTEEDLYSVIDAGYMCTLAIVHKGVPMMIPTAYARKEDYLYIHGAKKNFALNHALENDQICISIFYLDGIVLAQSLFNTGFNYRSAIIFGKAELVTDKNEHIEILKLISDNIIPGRTSEVLLGNEQQVNATLVLKIKIESASVKIRGGDPAGDEEMDEDIWSGQIPIKQIAEKPIFDRKRKGEKPLSPSVEAYCQMHKP